MISKRTLKESYGNNWGGLISVHSPACRKTGFQNIEKHATHWENWLTMMCESAIYFITFKP